MGDMTNALQAIVQGMQGTQLEIQQLAQASRKPPEGRCNVRIPTFDASQPEEYFRFERAARIALQANELQWPRAAYALLAAFQGVALDIASTIDVEAYNSTTEFMKALRELFTSPAGKNQARADFLTRTQRPGEDIMVFHGIMRDLFERAYESNERVEGHLIDCFIAGITHREAHEQLHMDKISGNLPTNYQGILVRAKAIIAQRKVIELERRRQAGAGQVGIEQFYRSNPSGAPMPPVAPQFPAPVPMEIGAVTAPMMWCEFHQRSSHNTRDCIAKKNQENSPHHRTLSGNQRGRGGNYNNQRGQTRPDATRSNASTPGARAARGRGTRQPNRTDQCGNCKGWGHFRAQCPSTSEPPRSIDHRTSAVEEGQYADNAYPEN